MPEAQPVAWYVIDRPLGRDRERKNRQAVEGLDAVPARSRWRMIESLGAFSLLEVQPLTGRTHQIRVHLASIGFPLAIDPLYAEAGLPPPPVIARLTLHARSITFKDARGKPVTVESPIPADFAAALDRLRAAK